MASTSANTGRTQVTLSDVARGAGVSVSTASRALSGNGQLSDATRGQVQAVARRLQFRPSPVARSLRMQETLTIGFVAPDIASPFYSASLKGAQQVLEAAGFRVMLMDTARRPENELDALRTLLDHRVDGLLLSTTGISDRDFIEIVGDETPCVFFDGILNDLGAASVSVDNVAGVELLVSHLADEHGHERIALLSEPARERSSTERALAYRQSMADRGLGVRDGFDRVSDWDEGSTFSEAVCLLQLDPAPTAILASSDYLALACLRACAVLGVRVPAQVAVVCFDDPYYGARLDPPLTCLRTAPGETGRRAAALLLDAIRSPTTRHDLRLAVSLRLRRSCGCRAAIPTGISG